MTEEFLQFIWKYSLFSEKNQYSTNGVEIDILEVGKHNRDAGPDFFDARVMINDVVWAGNVEIHVKSSNWNSHHHDSDSAYNNVILHVVYDFDEDIYTKEGRLLPCLQLDFNAVLFDNYKALISSKKWIPCFDEIRQVKQFFIRNWLDRMLVERLERKSYEINKALDRNSFSWEETFYQIIARYFGMKVNAEPFQQLARSIPLKFMARQKNSLLQIEAFLFGQAGLLNKPDCTDEYYQKLVSEYRFLSGKYKLQSLPAERWKWLRLRPANFPTIRIAQFAALIYKSNALFSQILENPNYNAIAKAFEIEASKYWKDHYQFGIKSKVKVKNLGRSALDGIIINSIVPVLFLYGSVNGNQQIKDKACELLDEVGVENNSVTKKWKECGIEMKSAYHSQALLQLKSEYCDKFRCLQCEFGNRLIRADGIHSTEY
ncbi:DUF2851 family protein [Ancylomarina longa]|uniref:DUF2851 family protein n=1 Tax=Ancylomarina longa TaxID=2487017 RepID=A0A434AF47_9BACT|nr:DUF2851 family protein [Ancylomarina longa]RUT72968.1 DUF2851 family protein [Ancylomarina longa]